MAKSASSRAISRFAQLSCLGLEPEAVVPALLEELHSIVPSLANTFYFCNARGETTNIYLENSEYYPLLPVYWEIIHERSELKFKGNSFSDAVNLYGAHTREMAVSADRQAIMRSDFYNLTERVVGYDTNFLRLMVRDGGRLVGGVRLWRSLGKGEWSNADRTALESLEPFLAHALSGGKNVEAEALADGSRQGLIVANASGKPLWLTTEGRRLLFLANHPRHGPGTTIHRLDELPGPLVALCNGLTGIFAGEPRAPHPSHTVRNSWGEFRFRAQWLDGPEAAGDLIAITVTHREPRRLVLARRAHDLGLTARQTEVCILLADGLSLTRSPSACRSAVTRPMSTAGGRTTSSTSAIARN